jgi:hypothetical protein
MMAVGAERSAWLMGGVGLLGSVAGWILAPAVFPHAWLAAFVCWIGWPLGSMGLIFIHALTGGRWGFSIRPQLASGAATMPLVLPAFLPVLLLLDALYPWMHADPAAPLDNHFYLNAPFFYARCLVYLIIWIGLAALVRHALRQKNPEPLLYRMAPLGLILLMLTVTFAAIDLTMSLDPHFNSSIYGMLAASEALLLALSIAVLGLAAARRAVDRDSVRDLGRLLFALLVLWAYLDFVQILIVWNSDLPEEANWYLERLIGGWVIVAVLIAVVHFALPFFALIWPQVQRSRRALGALATLLALAEIPHAWWVVIPAAGRQLSLLDVATMMAIIGFAAGIALRSFRNTRVATPAASHG